MITEIINGPIHGLTSAWS